MFLFYIVNYSMLIGVRTRRASEGGLHGFRDNFYIGLLHREDESRPTFS